MNKIGFFSRFIVIMFAVVFLKSCGVLFHNEVICRDFEHNDDLKWFA